MWTCCARIPRSAQADAVCMTTSPDTHTLSFVLFTLVAAFLLFRLFGPREEVLELDRSVSPHEEFRRRRKKFFTFGLPCSVGGMAMIILGGWLLTRPVSPGPLGATGFAITIAVLGLVSFGASVVYI